MSAGSPTTASGPPSPAVPSRSPLASPPPPDIEVGSTVITVSDRLRVRSAPGVGSDSIKYTPLLPLGTELRVLGGPVFASGYRWFEVELLGMKLDGGVTGGWVAAGEDAEVWLAPSEATLAFADVTRPAIDPTAARATAAGIDAFAVALYGAMLDDPKLALDRKNVVVSPASIAIALAMVRAGARGATADELDKALHASGWPALSKGMASLDQILSELNGTWKDPYEERAHALALRIANAAFVQQGAAIDNAYLESIGATFGAGIRQLDFAHAADAARVVINAWVDARTEGRIPELLPEGTPNEMSVMVLVNAVYLKAEWLSQFPTGRTSPQAFRRLDGSTVKVPTMQDTKNLPYAKGDGWQAVELPYATGPGVPPELRWFEPGTPYPALAMQLIRPSDFAAFEKRLGDGVFDDVDAALTKERTHAGATIQEPTPSGDEMWCGHHPYDIDLSMPRFKANTKASLGPSLEALGLEHLFANADLSGMGPEAAAVSSVVHQADIEVDEEGTIAAAATAADVSGGCTGTEPLKTISFKLDRPFLFVLRDTQTGAILFMGRVLDPSK